MNYETYRRVKLIGSLLMALPLAWHQVSVVDQLIFRTARLLVEGMPAKQDLLPVATPSFWQTFSHRDRVDDDLWVGLRRVVAREREKRTGGS
jgi:hypothetical protein